MKIWSSYRPGVYWVEPAEYGQPDRLGRRQLVAQGLKVEFTTLGGPGAGSLLDTEAMRWDEETREHVEQFLMSSNEWGFSLFIADEAMTAEHPRGGASCKVMTRIQGGVRACGRPVEVEGDLCDIHASQRTQLEAQDSQPLIPPPPPVEASV